MMFDHYEPKPWHFIFFPTVLLLLGLFLLYQLGESLKVWVVTGILWFGAFVMFIWMASQGIVQAVAQIDFDWLSRTQPVQVTYQAEAIPDHAYVNRFDPRWQTWATGICNGRSLARRDWTPKRKGFSREEYDAGIAGFVRLNVLKVIGDPEGNAGYKVNGAGGWSFIKALSEGQKYLPIPSPAPLEQDAPLVVE